MNFIKQHARKFALAILAAVGTAALASCGGGGSSSSSGESGGGGSGGSSMVILPPGGQIAYSITNACSSAGDIDLRFFSYASSPPSGDIVSTWGPYPIAFGESDARTLTSARTNIRSICYGGVGSGSNIRWGVGDGTSGCEGCCRSVPTTTRLNLRLTCPGGAPSASGQPDLVVESPSVSDATVAPGDRLSLDVTVRNRGQGASDSATLRYYRSTNSIISSSDQLVDTDTVRELDPGGTDDETGRFDAPTTAGTYYYGACVDSVSGESNTGNNCSSGVRVTVSGGGGAPQTGGGPGALVWTVEDQCTDFGTIDVTFYGFDNSGRHVDTTRTFSTSDRARTGDSITATLDRSRGATRYCFGARLLRQDGGRVLWGQARGNTYCTAVLQSVPSSGTRRVRQPLTC